MADGDEIILRVLRTKCYYERLDLQRGATEAQIKTAYRKMAAKVHPDKSRHARADEAFKAVGQANAVLSDPDKRAHYDRYGEDDGSNIGGGGGGAHVFRTNHPEDIFDIFEMFANGTHPGMRRQRRARQPQGGQHPGLNENFAQLVMIPFMFLIAVILFSGTALNTVDSQGPFSLNYDLERMSFFFFF